MGGLAQNLLEGFASAAGDQNTVNRFETEKANKTAMSHAELRDQTQSVLADVSGLQDKRSKLDPNSPTYKDDVAANDKALHDARQTLQDLYHPEKNPGALAHLGGFIRAHIGGGGKPRAMDEKIRPGDLKESMSSRLASLDAAASPSSSGATPDKMKQVSDAYQKTFGVPLPDDKKKDFFNHLYGGAPLAPKAEAENWVVQDVTTGDGKKVTLQRNTKSGEWTDLAGNPVSKEQLTGATVAPKASSAGPIRAWKRKGGKVVSVLLDRATNKEIPGSENPDIAPPAAQAGRITTGFYHFVDDNGQVHQIQETKTSMPAGSGGGGSGSVPKTAGEAKDKILGNRNTPSQNKAEQDFNEATKLAGVADEVMKHPDDAVNVKGFAIALERARAGRFTSEALNRMLDAGWGNKLEQWANNPTTGTLPRDILRQLVEGAHENVIGTQKAKDASKAGRVPLNGSSGAQFKAPAGAPAAPKEDGHKLKANGQVIAVSKGGQWVAP